jgi:dephospho-CoA kinase
MRVIGLTGGIGSGKSTVARLLEDKGAVLLNADLIGHEIYLPGKPAYDDVIEAFGREIVAEDGTIDRKKLGPIVFADPEKLARLNEITHPRIAEAVKERLAELEALGVGVAVIEAAILLEAGWEVLADEVWVTVVDPETAAKRAAERGGLDAQQVLERIRSQMTNEERVSRANVVISTEGGLEDTAARTEREWVKLQERLNGSS